MRAASQGQVDKIDAQLDLLPDPAEFEDFVNEHNAELKSKGNTNTIKTHIIGPMNSIIERVNKMAIAQKTLMDRTSNGISKLGAKIEELEQDLEESIDAKIEDALENLFNNDDKFQSKFHGTVKSLLYYEYFTYRLETKLVGKPNAYTHITKLIKSMAKTSVLHHPKTDFSPILNSNRLPTRNPNPISNSNNMQSNTNVNQSHQQLNTHQV